MRRICKVQYDISCHTSKLMQGTVRYDIWILIKRIQICKVQYINNALHLKCIAHFIDIHAMLQGKNTWQSSVLTNF